MTGKVEIDDVEMDTYPCVCTHIHVYDTYIHDGFQDIIVGKSYFFVR